MENTTDESSLLENPWMNVVDKEIKVLNLGEDAIVRLVYKVIRQLAAKMNVVDKEINGGMYSYLRP